MNHHSPPGTLCPVEQTSSCWNRAQRVDWPLCGDWAGVGALGNGDSVSKGTRQKPGSQAQPHLGGPGRRALTCALRWPAGPVCPAPLREPAWSGGGDGHCQAEGVSHEPRGLPAAVGTSLGTVLGTRTHLEGSQRWASETSKASQEQAGLVLPSRAQLDATGPPPTAHGPQQAHVRPLPAKATLTDGTDSACGHPGFPQCPDVAVLESTEVPAQSWANWPPLGTQTPGCSAGKGKRVPAQGGGCTCTHARASGQRAPQSRGTGRYTDGREVSLL